MLIKEILIERDVINLDDINNAITELSGQTTKPKVIQWLKSTFRKWLINSYPGVRPYSATASDPTWAQDSNELFQISIRPEDVSDWKHWVDYMNTIPEQNTIRMSVDQVEQKVQQWDQQLANQKETSGMRAAAEPGVEIVKKYKDGFYWANLTTKAALQHEGVMMGHCIGDDTQNYCADIVSGQSLHVSLRDPSGKSHVTVEIIKPNKIKQIKGPSNSGVKREYQKYVKDLIKSGVKGIKFKKVDDLENISIIVIDNVWYDMYRLPKNVQVAAVERDWELIQYIENPSEEVQLAAVKKNGRAIYFIVKDLGRNPSEDVQLVAVTRNGQIIKYIKDPSEDVQLVAVQEDARAIRFIKNPSKEIQLAAVTRNGWAIEFIKNPSEETQLAAVIQRGSAIEFIKNPSKEIQLAAVKKTGEAIKYIVKDLGRNPSEEVQLTAVRENGGAIQYINNPSEEVQLAAVTRNGYAIQFIKNPSEDVQLAAVTQSGYAIYHIKNPSEGVQLAAVTQNGYAIQYIKNPSEAMQLAAVHNTGLAIQYIKNPSDKVKAAAGK